MSDLSDYNKIIDLFLKKLSENLEYIRLSMLCNVKEVTGNYKDYPVHSVSTEFLSQIEFDELLRNAQIFGIYSDAFFNIEDFLLCFLNGEYCLNNKKYNILYETTQKGIGYGKDSLVPAFCDLKEIIYTGANAYLNSFCNNKFNWNKLLSIHNVNVPYSWQYNNDYGWTNNESPPLGEKIIIKPVYECACIGIDNNSVTYYSKDTIDLLNEKSEEFQQPLLVQKFISGYEVEVPVIISRKKILIFPPIGIKTNTNIKNLEDIYFTYDDVYSDKYSFYCFEEISIKISEQLRTASEYIVKFLNFTGYLRIDFRINQDWDFYVFDINTFPHIVKHSSFAWSFKKLGINCELILPVIVANAFINFTNS